MRDRDTAAPPRRPDEVDWRRRLLARIALLAFCCAFGGFIALDVLDDGLADQPRVRSLQFLANAS